MTDNFFQVSNPSADSIITAHTNLVNEQESNTYLDNLTNTPNTPNVSADSQLPGSVTVDYDKLSETATPKVENPDPWYRWGIRAAAQIGYSPLAGLIGALNESGKALEHVGDYLGSIQSPDKAPEGIPTIEPHGLFTHIPEPQPDTTGGQIAKSVAQFAWGIFGAGKFVKAGELALGAEGALTLRHPFITSIGTSSLAAATVFDAHEGNIANLVQEFPALQSPITNWLSSYLATGQDDTELSGRLKNAAANALIGIPAEGFMKLLGIAGNQMRAAKVAMDTTNQVQADRQEYLYKLLGFSPSQRQLALFGDPDAPPLKIYNAADAAAPREVTPAPGFTYESQGTIPDVEGSPQVLQRVSAPAELNRVPNTYRIGNDKYNLTFPTVEDRLAYIATGASKHSDLSKQTLMNAGWTEDQINSIGQDIRSNLEEQSKGNPTDTTLAVQKTARIKYSEGVTDLMGVPADYSASAIASVPITDTTSANINMAAIRDPRGLGEAVNQLKQAFEANPSFRSWADALRIMDPDQTLKRALGDRPTGTLLVNDSEIAAVDVLRSASLIKLKDLANSVQMAKDLPGGVPTDLTYAFGLQLNTHRMLSSYWNLARSEAGRALNILKSANTGMDPINRGMDALFRQLGGVQGIDNVKLMADIVSNLDNGTPDALKAFNSLLQDDAWTKAGKYLRAMYTNNLLSSWSSLSTNSLMPFVVSATQMAERGMGIFANRMLGDDSGLTYKQLAQHIIGYGSAIPEAAGYFPNAFRFGGKGRAWGEQYARGTMDELSNPGSFNTTMSAYLNPEGNWYLNKGIDSVGYINSWGTRTNVASDEFHTTVNYRAALRMKAVQQVDGELSSGTLTQADYNSRLQDLLVSPTKELTEQAQEYSHQVTFTQPNGNWMMRLAKTVQSGNIGPLGGWMLMPFKLVPANILSYSMDHSPLLALKQAELRSAIAQGGDQAQIALGKISGAVFTTAMGISMYQAGLLTGKGSYQPGEAQLMQREGIPPYSLKVGNTWYKYNKFDALGFSLGLLGDIGDLQSYLTDQDHDRALDVEKAAASFVLGVAGSALNKTYYQGITDTMQGVTNPAQFAQKLLTSWGTNFVPNEGALRSTTRLVDDNMKQVSGLVETIKANTPGLSKDQPSSFDLWGRPRTVSRGSSQAWNALMPVEMSVANPEPIDSEFAKQRIYIQMPDKQFNYGNYAFDLRSDNRSYARYVQLAGNETISPAFGMGCKDLLNATVTGQSPLSSVWDALGDETGKDSPKQKFIAHIITHYRKLAQQELLVEDPRVYHTLRRDPLLVNNVPVQ